MFTVLLTCGGIVAARILDVSLGTLRTIMVIQGRRGISFCLAFVELLVWVLVVSSVIGQVREQPLYAVAYALGFALGNYLGMTIERRLALGRQVVRIISRQGPELAQILRSEGRRVTQFDGYGRDGPVQELFIEVSRRDVGNVIRRARALDDRCYYMVDDVRMASSATLQASAPTGWRARFFKR
jgi:uncharacterized protein YebE (UPF0316 family)